MNTLNLLDEKTFPEDERDVLVSLSFGTTPLFIARVRIDGIMKNVISWEYFDIERHCKKLIDANSGDMWRYL